MSKYHSQKATYNGITFDSKRERDRYIDLLLLERAGEISELRLQVSFELIPKQRTQLQVYCRFCVHSERRDDC